MMVRTEDAISAARTIEGFCREHFKEDGQCGCPFRVAIDRCALFTHRPRGWLVDEILKDSEYSGETGTHGG